jgi:hypothetical protein
VIGGEELKIDPVNMGDIIKWSIPTNLTEVRRFFGASQYLQNFIASFSVVVLPLQ